MYYGLYLSAAGLQVSEYRQSVISNNLANVQTVGFKRDLAQVMSRQNAVDEDPTLAMYKTPVYAQESGGTLAAPGRIDLTQAAMRGTEAPFDVALEGPGFFTVQGEDGTSRLLTRNGQFTMNSGGLLVNQAGRPVLDAQSQPITLNPDLPVTISSSGEIRQGDSVVASMGIVNTNDPAQLQKVGGNLLKVQDPATLTPATTALVRQGYVEESGVDPSIEMVNMLDNQRVYEANAKMVQSYDRMLQQLNQVGRIS